MGFENLFKKKAKPEKMDTPAQQAMDEHDRKSRKAFAAGLGVLGATIAMQPHYVDLHKDTKQTKQERNVSEDDMSAPQPGQPEGAMVDYKNNIITVNSEKGPEEIKTIDFKEPEPVVMDFKPKMFNIDLDRPDNREHLDEK